MDKNKIVNSIYQDILRKFYEIMKTIIIGQDKDNDNYIKGEFNSIIELLEQCYEDVIDTDSILLLKDISFSDFLKDKYIIEAVSSNCTTLSDSDLFIKKTSRCIDDYFTYFRIIEKDDQYKAIKYCQGTISEENIDKKELNEFVSLNKALNDSKYVGFYAKQWNYEVTVLYSGQLYKSDSYFTLYKGEKGTLEFYVTDRPYSTNGFFQCIDCTEKRSPYIETESIERRINSGDEIEDKMFILNAIEEQIEKKYGQFNNITKCYIKK